jgi:hypothetical protein
MPNQLTDFLFGKGALDKAAGDAQQKARSAGQVPATPAYSTSDMAQMAEDSAQRARSAGQTPAGSKAPYKSPLSTPMTPVSQKGK